MSKLKSQTKPFDISKQEVWEAFVEVRANKGAAGVDGRTIAEFEKDLQGNLYKIWNRMSSGSYFPSPVRAVEIPKAAGGVRVLGIPTVADRVAQTVVARRLSVAAEPVFHTDSYGYRPGRSALDAIGVCRVRCWRKDWVIDLDIRAFFDSVPWDLLLAAVEKHTDQPWIVLYVRRWLAAPMASPDGTTVHRERGTPQGAPVSPVLANLFMHYAFDLWLSRTFPGVQFERYADDAVIHCATREQARDVLDALATRMSEVGLELHPDKTRIVYCKDSKRRGSYEHTSFTFCGYTFRPRASRNSTTGQRFTSFTPAVSKDAMKRAGQTVRRWRLHRLVRDSIEEIARKINPIIAGWMQYYGRFYRSALYPLLQRINAYLLRWLRNKYRRFRGLKAAVRAMQEAVRRRPRLFAHWSWVPEASPAWRTG